MTITSIIALVAGFLIIGIMGFITYPREKKKDPVRMVKALAKKLGLDIEHYPYTDEVSVYGFSGNFELNKLIHLIEDIRKEAKLRNELLLDYLKLEMCEGGEIRKKQNKQIIK